MRDTGSSSHRVLFAWPGPGPVCLHPLVFSPLRVLPQAGCFHGLSPGVQSRVGRTQSTFTAQEPARSRRCRKRSLETFSPAELQSPGLSRLDHEELNQLSRKRRRKGLGEFKTNADEMINLWWGPSYVVEELCRPCSQSKVTAGTDLALYLCLKTVFLCFLTEKKCRKTVSAGKRNSPSCAK